jgi:adenosylhomocysteine nucleosidase
MTGGGPLGIVAALPQELAGLIATMRADPALRTHTAGQRVYYAGKLWGTPCVLTLARVGKVAAAATTAALIHQFGVAGVVFTGVAGAAAAHVRVGDVVLADSLMQHDLDASPLFARYEVPLLGIDRLPTDAALSGRLARAADAFLRCAGLHPGVSTLHRGLILSGDQFIADPASIAALRQALPAALAVEMEGAAAAQVCYEYGVPCAVLRSISDAADAAAPDSFARFLEEGASRYSYGILQRFLTAEA